MATEAEIPESVYLKKGEREDNVLSKNLEEKVTELGNKVMQLESGSQPLETSSQVAETVNILETGKATNESETFIQALPVPMVTSNTLESCEAIRTEDQEESQTNKIEDFKEGKPNVDEQVEAVSTITEPEEVTENEDKYEEKATEKKASEGISPYNAESESGLELSESMASSKKEVLNMLEKDQGHNDDVISSQDATRDDLKETTTAEHTTTMADFKEQDPSEKPGEFVKKETEDKLTDAPEACEQSENETKENREEKPDESVKKSEEDEDNEEIRIGVQLEEKMEQNGLPHDITTDACISTQTTPEVKVTVNDEKNEEEAGKSDSPSIKEVCEETGEKVEYQEQAVSFEDVTIEGGFEEKIQQSEDNDHSVVKAKESIEEDTEEVRTVETPEKTEQQRLTNVIPTDVCIPTQIEPEEKVTENEERNDEMANENDDGQTKKSEKAESEEGLKLPDSSTITLKDNETASQDEDQQKEQELYKSEKGRAQSLAEEEHEEEVIEIKDGQEETCDNILIKDAFKEADSEKVEFESVEVSDRTILSKDETEEKEQELNMSEQGQEEDVITCSPDATSKVGETIKEYSKEMKTEKAEQQGLLHAITTDDHISSQAELQEEVIKNEEKVIEAEVKAIQSDGDQQEKSDNLFVKEVCEETDLKKTEAEEGIKISDSSNMLVSSQDAATEEDLQEKSCYNEGKPSEIVETRESVDKIESSVKTEEETEQQKLLHVITPDSCSTTQTEVPSETFEIEEKNEEAIENDVGQMNLESMEKEQELTMSEVQGGGDDLKTSQKEDEKKEEIGQHATTVEAGDFGETTKDIIEDETKAIDVQEANLNADGENGEREQMPEGIVNETLGACLEIEQDQHTKEIIPSVESNAEEATKNDEKATETDSDRKEKSDNPLVKEVFDETNLEKSECEKQIDFPETSNLNLDEKSIPVVTKDEDQEREQELKDETAVYEENLQEKSYDGEGNKEKIVETGESITKDIEEQEQEREKKHQNESNEPELVETRGCVVDDTQEIKSSVETKEYAETKPTDNTVEDEESKDEDAIENDDDQTKNSESPLVKEVCEATSSDRAESEAAVKLSDSFSTTLDENEMSKNENLEQEQETNISEIRGEEHDVISSQNVSNEETKENTIGQHATIVANFEEGQGVCAKNEEIIKKEPEDESIDAGKASKQCENDANDKAEQNPEESVNKSVNSCSEIVEGNVKEDEETNKEIEAELDVDSQRNRAVDGSEMKDEVVSTEKMPSEVGQSKEQYVEDIQTCLTESLGEKTEDEITTKNEIEDKDGNTNKEDKTFLDGRTREIEVSTLEHAPVEEKNGDLDEVSKEKFTDLKEITAVEPQEDSRPSNSLETSMEESSNLEKVKAESENLPKYDLESGSEVQIPEVLPTSEESKQNDENPNSETIMHEDEEKGTITKDISSDEKQATEIMQETFEEVCEETSSEKAELKERLKLSDSSNMEINEKAVTSGDEDQEKDQDVNISIESQGKDNITSSHDAVSEKENLLTRSYQNEGDEHEFLETSESVDEDTKETKSSVESKDNKFETPLFKEVCEATTSEKAESEDDGVKHSEASNTKPDENEIARKEENLEKEQDLTMSEVQGDGDDVTSTNEVIKEATISQSANMVGNFEEEQDLSAVTKEIIEEEAGDKSIDAQEANKECQDGAKDESEQNLEESVSKPVKPCVENVEEHFTEDEADARYSNEIEAKVDAENQVDRTENRGEIEDEVFSAGKIPSEVGQPKELNVEEIETCLAKTMTEKTEYETTKKENDSSHDSIEDTNGNATIEEKSTSEHEPVEEQNDGLDGVSKEILTDLNETAAVEPEDITPSASLGTSTEDTSNSEKAKAESESLAIATHVDEEKRTATEEISSDQESEKLYISTKENVIQVEQIAENSSPNGERDTEEDVTQEDQLNSTVDCSETVKDVILTKEVTSEEDQLNSTEDCSEMVKDVILTKEVTSEIQKENETTDFEEQVVDKESYSQNQKEMAHEISYPDPISVGKPEMTEVKVNTMIGQELKVAEGISCESKVKNDSVYQAPKEEQIPSLEDAATVEPEVDLQSKIKSTAYPSESEKLTIQALEPVCNVQTSEVITELEDSTIKEERIVLETVGHTDENKVQEEQIIRTDEILSAPDTEEENEGSSFLQNTEEKSLSKEKLELLGEVKPTSESVIVEVQANETKSQPEHLDITSENIMNDQTLESKLEHTKEKKLEDVKMDVEEDVTQAPEIKGAEEKNETEKNAILTDQVVVEPTKENERIEVEGQVSEEDSSTTKLETTSTSNQTELTNEIEYSKPIPVSNTEETEMKAESHLELGNIPAAEDLDCLSKASSTLEASNTERDDGTEKSMTAIREVKDESVDETSKDEVVPVVEDVTELELEANLPEIKSTDIPSDSQDSMKLTEGIPCSTQETIELKDDELISEVETHEALVKMRIQEEHPETTNDKCDTYTAGVSSEKLLDEPEKLDITDDTEEIAEGDKKALEESYQDAVAGVTGHEQFSQTEELKEPTEKLESMMPTEEPTPPTYEDQTNKLTLETDKTKVEHGSLSNKDKNPESEEEEFAKPFSEDQSIKERYVEEEVQGKCCVEDTEEKSGNEVVEDVIVNEVLMEDETTKESLNIKDNNNEKAIQNQLTSVTEEVSQIERLSSSPDELLEKKDLVEDAEKPKLVAETLEIKDTTFTVMKESNEAIDIPALEIENSESIVKEEKIIESDADKEKEPLEDPRADASAEAVSGSISSALEHNIDVWSEESKGHGDVNKPEEKPTEAFEITSEVAEIVPNDREVSAISTDSLLETSPEMLLAKHEPKLTTAPEKIEDEIKDKEVACKSVEKTGELQVSTLNSEIVEGKQDGPDDIQNKEKEPVQPQEQEKLVDPPSDFEIKEQEASEENALLSQNDKKIEDSPTLQSVEKEIMQRLDKGFEEAPVIELQNNEKGLDHTTDIRTVDVVNNAECSEVEPPKLDTKLETSEFVNQENLRDQKIEVDEHKEAASPVEDVKSSTPELEVPSVMDETADKEGSNEDPEDKKAEVYEAEKGILTDNKYPGITFGISKPTEEVPGMKQEPLELNAPMTLGTEATEDLKISQKYVTNLSHDQAEPTEKSFTADSEDLNASKASGTEAQCGNEVTQDERKTSDEKKKSESAESTKGKTEVSENLNKEIDPALTKDQQVDKEETVDSAVKTDEENEEDNEKLGSCSDAPVMVEASKDMDVKVHKKSHNMLSGVGSKVKHSIAKVKKAITGKSFQPKPTSS